MFTVLGYDHKSVTVGQGLKTPWDQAKLKLFLWTAEIGIDKLEDSHGVECRRSRLVISTTDGEGHPPLMLT